MAVQTNINNLNGINPLSYMGVNPYTPPDLLIEQRDPTENDNNFQIGTLWTTQSPHKVWMLITLTGGVATWIQIYPQGSTSDQALIVTSYVTPGTYVWTPNDNTQFLTVYVWGAGQGGNAGGVGVSGTVGGSGGNGAGCARFTGPIIAYGNSVPILVAAGGTGGTPTTPPGSTLNTAFGNIVVPPADSGRGVFIDMGPSFSGTLNGFGSGSGGSNSAGGPPNSGGGGFFSFNYYQPEYNTYTQATGGGIGGECSTVSAQAGTSGGRYVSFGGTSGGTILAGGAGGIESGTIDGSPGQNQQGTLGILTAGTGGGGGGGAYLGMIGGRGGDGGFPGGGGGGGGAALTGGTAGNGGNGGNGMVLVIEHTGIHTII